MLRYAAWRAVIAEFVAARLGRRADDLVAQTIAHAALGTSTAAFVRWVGNPDDDLEQNLRDAYRLLATSFAEVS